MLYFLKNNKSLRNIYYEKKSEKNILLLFQVILLVMGVMNTFLYNYLINHVVTKSELSKIPYAVIGMILVYGASTVVAYMNCKHYNRIFLGIKSKVRASLLYYNYVNKKTVMSEDLGETKNIIENDTDKMENYLYTYYVEIRILIVTMMIYMALMLYNNVILTILCIILIPLNLYSIKKTGKYVEKSSSKYRERFSGYESYLFSSVKNWKEIKGNNLQEIIEEQFDAKWKILSKEYMKNEIFKFLNTVIISFQQLVLIQAGVYVVGGILLVYGKVSIATILIFVNYYSILLSNINNFSDKQMKLKEQKNSVDRVMNILEKRIENKVEREFRGKEIQIQHLKFHYPNVNQNVLIDVNMTIEENTFVVIAGVSGCGKSTLLKLLCGMLEPDIGTIKIGGVDIGTVSHDYLMNKISIIMQDNFFFNMTIRENLLLANPDATDEEIWDVCIKVNIFQMINDLPEKLDTVLGENALNLSGGQRQRLAIARALLHKTDIMLFDEISSALDSENVDIIVNLLKELAKDHIVICVSHKNIFIEAAVRLYEMREGRLVLIKEN